MAFLLAIMRLLSKVETEQIVEPRAYLTKMTHGLITNLLRRRDIEAAYLNALAVFGGTRKGKRG